MNKSSKIMAVLAGAGLIDAVYLYIIKLVNKPVLCIQGIGDCWSVNTSQYSEILGVPVSLLGAAAYIAIILLVVFENRLNWIKPFSSLILFGITFTGVIYSAYLTYLEFRVIHAVCPFCIVSALLMTTLFIFSILRLVKDQS